MKLCKKSFKYNISIIFFQHIRMKHQGNKNQNNEKKYLQLEKGFIEITDKEIEERKEKIKREIEELLHQAIIVSKDNTNNFEEQKMKKRRPIIRKWFDRLINKNVMEKKPETIRDKLEANIITDISRLF